MPKFEFKFIEAGFWKKCPGCSTFKCFCAVIKMECWLISPFCRSKHLVNTSILIRSVGGKKHYWSPDNECNTFISCRHSVSFLCFYSQESSCCSALPSLLRVCTTCCGLSPTFCSQHPYGAVKCKRDAGTLKNTPKQVYLSPSRWTKAYRLLLRLTAVEDSS